MLGKSLFSQLSHHYVGKILALCWENPCLAPEFHQSHLQCKLGMLERQVTARNDGFAEQIREKSTTNQMLSYLINVVSDIKNDTSRLSNLVTAKAREQKSPTTPTYNLSKSYRRIGRSSPPISGILFEELEE